MKKRFICAFLALIMLVSLVPVTALTASAASYTTSTDAIRFIKEHEAFSWTCHADGDRYSIGYGTECEKSHSGGETHTIEEADASAALLEELPAIEKAINGMGLNLTQNQFDALVSFSYNCGTAWIYGNGTFKSAVVNRKTGNDFIYAISLWSNGSEFMPGLMNRRLAEANMYLNGVYSKTPPSNYTYVLYSGNGGTVSDKMQGYNSSSAVAIKAEASRADYTFMGWYTASNKWVPSLTASEAKQTLYAHWQAKNADPLDHVVDYTLTASQLADKTIYDKVNGKNIGTVTADSVKIVRDYIDANGVKWGKISGKNQWVKLTGSAAADKGETNTPAVGAGTVVTVTNAYINVRQQPAATSNKVGTVYYGEQYTLLDVANNNGSLWGQTEKGWIALMYTNYDLVKVETDNTPVEDKVIATAVVKCDADSYVNVRRGAGVNNTSVGQLKNGSKVDIYEITTVDGQEWGRIASGWFCLNYATVTEAEAGSGSGSDSDSDSDKESTGSADKVIATGTVISNTALNVRSVPTTINNYPIATKAKGTILNIYEIVIVDNGGDHEWGRIGVDQWVCLDYVSYTKLDVEEDKTDNKTESTNVSGMFTGTVNADVNVRKAANASSEKLGAYAKGDKIGISEVVKGVKADNTTTAIWGKVQFVNDKKETVDGWICLTGNVTLNPAYFEVISNSLNVREAAGTKDDLGNDHKVVGKLGKGTVVEITEITFINDTTLWGKSEKYGGWMNITSTYMKPTTASTSAPSTGTDGSADSNSGTSNGGTSTGTTTNGIIGTGVVNGVQLNVRSGPGFTYGKVDTLMPGSEITIRELATADGLAWGRTDYGWVSLGYILMTSTGITGNGQKATVANSYIGVNVRDTASTNSTLLTKIMVNSRIEILEQKTVNGSNWGRTLVGWVSMDYVLLDSSVDGDIDEIINGGAAGGTTGGTTDSNTSTSTSTSLSSYAAVATAATDIYKAAGSDVTVGVRITKDQAINVYELAVDGNGVSWARVDEGWVKSSGVKLNAIKQKYTVINNTLNVRSTPDSSVDTNKVGKLVKGDVVEVTELAIYKDSVWGKVTYINDKNVTITGWISTNAKYVALGDQSVKEETTTPTTPSTPTTPTTPTTPSTGTTNNGGILYTGTVDIWDGTAAKLKVRETAGGKEIDSLSPGVKVNIVETTIINNMPWGKCGAGWICLTYVDLVPTSGAADARVVLYANSVIAYEGAGTQYATTGTIAKGTIVDILEVSGSWVRTPMGWIQASYLAP